MTLKLIVLILLISTMVNCTLLNFGKRYKDDLRVIFDQRQKLHLGLDALSNQKNLKRYLRYNLIDSILFVPVAKPMLTKKDVFKVRLILF